MTLSYNRMRLAAATMGASAAILLAPTGAAAQQRHHEAGVNHGMDHVTPHNGEITAVSLGYHLTFSSNFNGTTLNRKKWIDSYPGGVRTHSNNEQQYYSPHGYNVSHGALHLIGSHVPMGGMQYTSGMIASYGHFAQKYGWFEIRAKFPAGKGYWPAFWLLPSDRSWPPEVDILEILGDQPDKVYLTNHYSQDGRPAGKGGFYVGPDFSKGYHTFSLQWTPTKLVWYVDGVARYSTTANIPHVPMYVIANLAIGGDWPGMPDANTKFPQSMDVDWIRVYQK